jgi:hypothetical protein
VVAATQRARRRRRLPLHKTSTKKAVVRQPLNLFFPEAIDETTSRAQIIPLLKRINESLLSPREVVTLSYENGIQSKLVVHKRWRDRFRGTHEAGNEHGNGPKDIRKANVHRKRGVAGWQIAGAG